MHVRGNGQFCGLRKDRGGGNDLQRAWEGGGQARVRWVTSRFRGDRPEANDEDDGGHQALIEVLDHDSGEAVL